MVIMYSLLPDGEIGIIEFIMLIAYYQTLPFGALCSVSDYILKDIAEMTNYTIFGIMLNLIIGVAYIVYCLHRIIKIRQR